MISNDRNLSVKSIVSRVISVPRLLHVKNVEKFLVRESIIFLFLNYIHVYICMYICTTHKSVYIHVYIYFK